MVRDHSSFDPGCSTTIHSSASVDTLSRTRPQTVGKRKVLGRSRVLYFLPNDAALADSEDVFHQVCQLILASKCSGFAVLFS